jgi:hypothetical protein
MCPEYENVTNDLSTINRNKTVSWAAGFYLLLQPTKFLSILDRK